RGRPRSWNVLVRTVPANSRIVPEMIHSVVDEQPAEEQAAGQEEDRGHVITARTARVSRMRAPVVNNGATAGRLSPVGAMSSPRPSRSSNLLPNSNEGHRWQPTAV